MHELAAHFCNVWPRLGDMGTWPTSFLHFIFAVLLDASLAWLVSESRTR